MLPEGSLFLFFFFLSNFICNQGCWKNFKVTKYIGNKIITNADETEVICGDSTKWSSSQWWDEVLLAEPGAEMHGNKIFQFKAQLQAAVDFSLICPFVSFEALCTKCYAYHIRWDSANIKTNVLATDKQCLHNFKAFLCHSAAPESRMRMSEGMGVNTAGTAVPNWPRDILYHIASWSAIKLGGIFLKYLLEDWPGIDLVVVSDSFCATCRIIEAGRNF